MNRMKYRGYTARIEFDEVDRIFVGHLAGIKDIVGFRMKFTLASMACCSNLANCRYGKRFGRSSPTR